MSDGTVSDAHLAHGNAARGQGLEEVGRPQGVALGSHVGGAGERPPGASLPPTQAWRLPGAGDRAEGEAGDLGEVRQCTHAQHRYRPPAGPTGRRRSGRRAQRALPGPRSVSVLRSRAVGVGSGQKSSHNGSLTAQPLAVWYPWPYEQHDPARHPSTLPGRSRRAGHDRCDLSGIGTGFVWLSQYWA